MDMVDQGLDITRGLLNQDMVAHMVDTLGDPMEDSQEVMVDPTLDIPEVMVATQEDIGATQVDIVDPELDITRGLLNQDMVVHMVDTLGDPVEDSQEFMVDTELYTQGGMVATLVDMVDTIKNIPIRINTKFTFHLMDEFSVIFVTI